MTQKNMIILVLALVTLTCIPCLDCFSSVVHNEPIQELIFSDSGKVVKQETFISLDTLKRTWFRQMLSLADEQLREIFPKQLKNLEDYETSNIEGFVEGLEFSEGFFHDIQRSDSEQNRKCIRDLFSSIIDLRVPAKWRVVELSESYVSYNLYLSLDLTDCASYANQSWHTTIPKETIKPVKTEASNILLNERAELNHDNQKLFNTAQSCLAFSEELTITAQPQIIPSGDGWHVWFSSKIDESGRSNEDFLIRLGSNRKCESVSIFSW